MKLTDLFIRRPVLALVVNIVIVLAGLQATTSLTVRQYPRNDNSSVTITTAYVGASAELVRGFVTTPIERAIAAAEGIDYIESRSLKGVSEITARLELNYDPIEALADISSKVDQVRNDLPPEAEVPVIDVVSADSERATAYLSFVSDRLGQNEITDYLVRLVQPRLSSIEGVQQAQILGARTFAMRIWLDPEKMASLNISPSEVNQALADNNFLAAVGQTKGSLVSVDLSANTDLKTPEEFRQLVVRSTDDTLIRLGEIADVQLGAEDYGTEVSSLGETAVFMGIFPQPTANAIDVLKLVREELDRINKELPEGLQSRVNYDATEYINGALREVVITLIETLAIVIVVIFLFMGSVRTVLIPITAIPLSLIGGVFLMQTFGFSLNLLTILAIVLAVGLVVDDAIIIVENIARRISEGLSPMEAALKGTRELIGPVIATTITLVAVYAPIGLQGGLTGSYFREFAFTLAGAVVVSSVVALTLSPMMSSKVLKPGLGESGFAGFIARVFEKLRSVYTGILRFSLDHRLGVYVVWIALGLLTIPMFLVSKRELAPEEDQGVIFGILEASAENSVDQTSIYAEAINDVFTSFDETEFTFQITSATDGFGGMVLKPWADRERNVFEIFPEATASMGAIPGVNFFLLKPPTLPGGGNFPVEFVIASTVEHEQLLEVAQQLQLKAIESGLFAFPPPLDLKIDKSEYEVVIDRELAGVLDLDMSQIGRDLSVFYSDDFVNRFNIEGRSYKVIPQIKRSERLNPEQLGDVYVTGPGGELVPLSTFATLEKKVVPRTLNRFQQLNSVKISGVPTRPLDDALSFLEEEAAKILPDGYQVGYTGESRQLRVEGSNFLPTFMLALTLIFLVLAAQFNSFRDPLIILLGSVPLALFGALIFIFLKNPNPMVPFFTDGWTTTLNIYSQVGMVTLVGLIAKNGILVVEFANSQQLAGLSKRKAVEKAALIRLRPILMTSVATIAGHFPLVLVTGAGAEARNSIGLVLVGGMAIGTIFTLIIVPAVYMLFAQEPNPEEIEAEAASQDAAVSEPSRKPPEASPTPVGEPA
ncbi:MAG: efflux RND transporter permease subunit [Opitutales bacterium]